MTKIETLINAVKTQNERLTSLQQILETELHLISGREPEPLIKLVEEKQQLLDNIQHHDQLISAGFQALDPTEQADKTLNELFEKAKDVVEQCKYRTSINQTALEQGQLRLEHLRTILLESRAKENLTYDKRGKATAKSGTNNFKA